MIDQSMSCRQPCGRVLSWALGHSVFVFFLFFFSILWGRCRTNDHPQEEWAKFSYRSDRKLEQNIQNPCLVLVSSNKYGDFRLIFSLKIWRLWLFYFFPPREILCTPRTGFCDRSVEFCHKQKHFSDYRKKQWLVCRASRSIRVMQTAAACR